jgi:hypothetical protein
MNQTNHLYRVLRPVRVAGRIAGTGELVALSESRALECVESGHLEEVSSAPATRQH